MYKAPKPKWLSLFPGWVLSEATKPGLAFRVPFMLVYFVIVYFVTDACLLCCVCFSFSVLSQDKSEECLRNDLFSVGWDVQL